MRVPEFKVGDIVVVERRYFARSEAPHVSHERKIVRETRTRFVLDCGSYIEKGTDVVKPRYLDYLITARPKETA